MSFFFYSILTLMSNSKETALFINITCRFTESRKLCDFNGTNDQVNISRQSNL